jgi:hypothetical protein
MLRFRLAPILLGLLLLAVACGSQTQPIGIVASSNGSLEVGEQRVLVGLVDTETQAFLASPDLTATAALIGPNEETIEDVPLEFVWAVPEQRGLYRATIDFPTPGGWSISISADGYASTEPTLMMVAEETAMPQVGDAAPAVATRTGSDFPLEEITTDPAPEPSFYDLSLDEALADDRPTVVIFATPAFCTSATCGPVLESAKQVQASHPEADFLHVEIYENLDADSYEDLVTVEAVDAWALPSEPWVFVTDPSGTITARFEGTVDPAELDAALTALGA